MIRRNGEQGWEILIPEMIRRAIMGQYKNLDKPLCRGLLFREMKRNAMKWKAVAEASFVEGESSYRNIQAFVDEVKRRSLEVLAANCKSAANGGADLASKVAANGVVELEESKVNRELKVMS
ncbi:PCRF domain-containing protein [Psidium guajava]|nr:PCRF domain-containing protein [Psidium guajava]